MRYPITLPSNTDLGIPMKPSSDDQVQMKRIRLAVVLSLTVMIVTAFECYRMKSHAVLGDSSMLLTDNKIGMLAFGGLSCILLLSALCFLKLETQLTTTNPNPIEPREAVSITASETLEQQLPVSETVHTQCGSNSSPAARSDVLLTRELVCEDFTILLKDPPPSADTPSTPPPPSSTGSFLQRARESSAASLASLARVSSSASVKRLSQAVQKLASKSACFTGRKPTQFEPVLSTPEPFVPTELLAELTLDDIATVVRYTQMVNKDDFDEQNFVKDMKPPLRRVLTMLDVAVSKSRGPYTLDAKLSESTSSGNIDAFVLAGAMRIFAEWRSERVVPEGHKTYCVGMTMAKRDLIANIGKLEEAAQRWAHHELCVGAAHVPSPTIRQLLEYEIWTNAHPQLPRLKDKTAAIGLVWMIRQINFQTRTFANLLEVSDQYTAPDAIRAAYKEVFGPYHGWITQQIFNKSFNGAPPVEEMYELMNPAHYDLVVETGRNGPQMLTNADDGIVDEMCPLRKSFSSQLSGETEEETVESDYGDDDGGNDSDGVIEYSKEEDLRDALHLDQNIRKQWENFVENLRSGCGVGFCGASFQDQEPGRTAGPLLLLSGPTSANTSFDSYDEQLGMMLDDEDEDDTESNGVVDEAGDLPSVPLTRQISIPLQILNDEELDAYIEREMTKAAHNQIELYLEAMDPLLADLDHVVNDLGMNDPSKA